MEIKKYLPQIMAIGSIVGVITTSIIAVKNKDDYEDLLMEERHKKPLQPIQPSTKLQIFIKAYRPTFVSGGLTISCIAGSYILNKKQQASLIGAYHALNGYFDRYQQSAKNVFGEDAHDQILADMARSNPEVHFQKLDAPDNKCVFYEPYSNTNFVMYERELMDAEYHLNRNYCFNGRASLNDLLSMLGVPTIPNGDDIGWDISSGIYWIDFCHKKVGNEDDGTPIYSVYSIFAPEPFEDD